MICFVFQACPKWPTKSPNFAASSHLYQVFGLFFKYGIYRKHLFVHSVLNVHISQKHKKGTGIKDIKDQKTDIEDIKGGGCKHPFFSFYVCFRSPEGGKVEKRSHLNLIFRSQDIACQSLRFTNNYFAKRNFKLLFWRVSFWACLRKRYTPLSWHLAQLFLGWLSKIITV